MRYRSGNFSVERLMDFLTALGLAPSIREDCKDCDSAEKPYECFDEAQHERKMSNDFDRSSVRPKVLEG